jgi:tetratricopeptide (TPR) repeat protein
MDGHRKTTCRRSTLAVSTTCNSQIMLVALALCISGCGLLDRSREEEVTRFVTRGQQPLNATTQRQTDDAQKLVQRASRLYSQGRLRDAQAALRSARQANPSLTTTFELDARIALDLGDMVAYRAALQETLNAHPESAVLQNTVGKRLVENGLWEQGVKALNKAYELAPRNAKFARDLAAACLDMSDTVTADTATAGRVLTQAMRRNPHDTTLPAALARFHESSENWQDAARYYGVALKADPHNLTWRRQLARCLYKLGDYADACDVYSACIESDSSSVSLSEYAEFADACLRIGDVQRAQMVYDRISRYSPVRSREVELLRVICAVRRNDLPRARSILRDALVLWPADKDLLGLVELVAEDADSPETSASAKR